MLNVTISLPSLPQILSLPSHFPLCTVQKLKVCQGAQGLSSDHPPQCSSVSWPHSRANAQPGAGWEHTGSRCCGCPAACGPHSPVGWSAARQAELKTHSAVAWQYLPADTRADLCSLGPQRPPTHRGCRQGGREGGEPPRTGHRSWASVSPVSMSGCRDGRNHLPDKDRPGPSLLPNLQNAQSLAAVLEEWRQLL